METINLSLRVAVGTFFLKSPVCQWTIFFFLEEGGPWKHLMKKTTETFCKETNKKNKKKVITMADVAPMTPKKGA